jgi:hypothetical protein
LIEQGSATTYLPNYASPGIIAPQWYEEAFTPDAAWSAGIYGVGYDTAGDAANLIDTSVASGARSIYTRASFDILPTEPALAILVAADYDDGWVAWINGTEVYRSAEMPAGEPTWSTPAAGHESSNGPQPDYRTPVDVSATASGVIRDGTNLLAVGVWNDSASSSDLVLVPRLSILTSIDNCPDLPNPGQEDGDSDGIGDACDPS